MFVNFPTNTNCNAPPSQLQLPRIAAFTHTNCFVENPTSPVRVTPRGPTQDLPPPSYSVGMGDTYHHNQSMSNSSHYHRAGSIHTHRRGSYSVDMLPSTMNEINGNQQTAPVAMCINGANASVPAYNHSHAHASQPHPFAAAAPQQQQLPQVPAQFGVPHQVQQNPAQRQSFGRPPANSAQHKQHSVLTSMDLVLPSSFSHQPHANQRVSFDKNSLFKSSSHHTSHTAAAGDLLSMSRTRDTESPSGREQMKKRTASYGDYSHMDMDASMSNQFGVPQQQQQQRNVFLMGTGTPSAAGAQPFHPRSFVSQVSEASIFQNVSSGASVGSVYSHQQQEHDGDSYQHHTNKRRCLRSSSFDMMDDGC